MGFEEDLENRVWADQSEQDSRDTLYGQDADYDQDYEEYDNAPEDIPEDLQKAADTAVRALDALKFSMKKNREEKKTKKRRRRKKANPFLVLFIIILLIIGSIIILNSDIFAIRNIEVEGNRFYTPSQIIEMSGIESGKNLFFELKTRPARNNLLKSPYIKSAKIERIPTGTVRITVEERLEYAAISAEDGGFWVIDKDGMVLRKAEEAPEVTIMEGIELDVAEEGKPVKAKQTYLFTETLRLLAATVDNDLYFKKVFFSSAVVRAYLGEQYYCEGAPENIFRSLPAIKELAEQHYAQNINKGVIKVGTNGYLSFNPKVDQLP